VSGLAFTFRCTTANSEPEFEGFELYYKFYTNEQTPNEGITDRSGLLAAGFDRVCEAPPEYHNDIDKPLIEVIPPDDIEFTLDFAASPEPTVTSFPAGITVIMRRAAYYSSSTTHLDEFKSFDYDYDAIETYMETDDPDYGSEVLAAIDARSDLHLTLYVLSYGKQEYATDLYSSAVCLKTIGPFNLGW